MSTRFAQAVADYLDCMDLAAILCAIDAEIEKLKKVREILLSVAKPIRLPRMKAQARKREQEVLPFEAEAPARGVEAVVVPPVKRREYRPRGRAAAPAAGALAAAPAERPVFVPRAQAPVAVVKEKPEAAVMTPDQMEAAMRRKLMGGMA